MALIQLLMKVVMATAISRVARCNHKRRYRDHREAVHMLHKFTNQRRRAEQDGRHSKRREVRCYACNRCHGYHLTSWA